MQTFQRIIGVSVGAALALSGNSPSSAVLAGSQNPPLQTASLLAQAQNVPPSEQSADEQPQKLPATVPKPSAPEASPVTETAAETASPPLPQTEIAQPVVPQQSQVPQPDIFPPDPPDTPAEVTPPPYLDPDANPLLFPTQPEEVRIQATQPLTLEQALELARRNNRELQVARLELERSRAVLRQALAAEYPTVTLQSDLTRQQSASGQIAASESPEPRLGPDPDAPGTSLSGTLQISYDLYTGGRRSANIEAAERQSRLNELEVERIDEQLRLEVVQDYYDLQEASEQVRIRQQAVVNAQSSLRDAEALERAGVGTRFAVLQAQVQLANEQQRLAETIAQLRTSRRQLAQRLSLPQYVDITAADPVQIAGRWQLPLEESIVLALKNRSELEQLLVQRELNEAQRRAALAALDPQVTLFANYNVLKTTSDDPLSTQGAGDGYTLGARVTWTLYDGGEARAIAQQESVDIAIAETNFADNRNQVRFQVEQAYFALLSSFENIQTASVALEQAREALRLARLRFQAGVGTQTEVINAETDLTDAEFNRIQAVLGYNRALAQLQRAISNFSGFTVPITSGTP